jgi:hypothetical protein
LFPDRSRTGLIFTCQVRHISICLKLIDFFNHLPSTTGIIGSIRYKYKNYSNKQKLYITMFFMFYLMKLLFLSLQRSHEYLKNNVTHFLCLPICIITVLAICYEKLFMISTFSLWSLHVIYYQETSMILLSSKVILMSLTSLWRILDKHTTFWEKKWNSDHISLCFDVILLWEIHSHVAYQQ